MRRWPSISYLIFRDSRVEQKRARDALVAHCRSCGCLVCQVRLVVMNEDPAIDIAFPEEKIVVKEFLN